MISVGGKEEAESENHIPRVVPYPIVRNILLPPPPPPESFLVCIQRSFNLSLLPHCNLIPPCE